MRDNKIPVFAAGMRPVQAETHGSGKLVFYTEMRYAGSVRLRFAASA
jgi:hypothetical protein